MGILKYLIEQIYNKRILKEFPVKFNGKIGLLELDNEDYNIYVFNSYKNSTYWNNAIEFDGLKLIEYSSGNIYWSFLFSTDRVVGACKYYVDDNFYKENQVWQLKGFHKGLMRNLYINHFLDIYNGIISDNHLTSLGFGMWRKIIVELYNNTEYNCGILNHDNKFILLVKNENDLIKYDQIVDTNQFTSIAVIKNNI